MATHSSILAWEIPWAEETGGLQPLGSQESDTTKQQASVSSVAQLCATLCNPMSCSTLGLPVHHQLQEFTQTHVH